jgi:transcriptional regulator with XRE-family HTH domain
MGRRLKVQRPGAIPMREWFDPRKLRAWRVRRNLTQGELAVRIGWDKVHGGSCISRYETAPFRRNRQLPNKDTVTLLAAALNIDVGQLLSSREELLQSVRLMIKERKERPKGPHTRRQRSMFDRVLELALTADKEDGGDGVEFKEDADLAKEFVESPDGNAKIPADFIDDYEDGDYDEAIFQDMVSDD